MKKSITYAVRGHWPFPTDMLRHDGSWPATDADRDLIEKLSEDHTKDRSYFEDVEIALRGFTKPNTARWESFGWAVPSDEEHAFYKSLRIAERKRQTLISSALAKLTREEREALGHGTGDRP